VGYWLLFLRAWPPFESSFEYTTNLKLFVAYLSYPFCPSLVVLGLIGATIIWRSGRRDAAVLLLTLGMLLFYARNLATPKHIIVIVLPLAISAGFLIHRLGRALKTAAFASIAFWWVFSVTPYGLFGPERGKFWPVPSVDGPIPTGAYATFYPLAGRGFFQHRYRHEISSCAQLIDAIHGREDSVTVLGAFNFQSMAYASVMRGLAAPKPPGLKQSYFDLPKQRSGEFWMIQRSYLWLANMKPALRTQLEAWLEEGRIRATVDSPQPFPEVVEVGPTVPIGYDRALGQRILFLNRHTNGRGVFPLLSFVEEYQATSWVSAGTGRYLAAKRGMTPLYADEQFAAFGQPVEGAIIMGLSLPGAYYGERDPRGGVYVH